MFGGRYTLSAANHSGSTWPIRNLRISRKRRLGIMSTKSGRSVTESREPGQHAPQFADRSLCLSGGPSEYTNWRDEQRAWRETCVLFDQSHHMVEHVRRGPRCPQADLASDDQQLRQLPGQPRQADRSVQLRWLCHRRRNSLPSGREQAVFVGRAPSANWIQFHAETGGYNVDDVAKDDRSPSRPGGKPVVRNVLPLPDSGTECRSK